MATDKKISELTADSAPLDADLLVLVDTANTTSKKTLWSVVKSTLKTYFDAIYPPIANFTGSSSGTNTGDETAARIGVLIGGAGDATPNDTDFVATSLTAAGTLKKITWTNVKAFLKTYFDTLYVSLPIILSAVPKPLIAWSSAENGVAFSVNTTQSLYMFSLSHKIVVNSISIRVDALNSVNGTYDLVIYSEDGQTQKISVTTDSISATSTIITTAVSGITLTPGNYYFAINPNGTASMKFTTYSPDVQGFSLTEGFGGDVTGKPKLAGTQVITAGVPATTFTPSSLTEALLDNVGVIFRLDN